MPALPTNEDLDNKYPDSAAKAANNKIKGAVFFT